MVELLQENLNRERTQEEIDRDFTAIVEGINMGYEGLSADDKERINTAHMDDKQLFNKDNDNNFGSYVS